MLGHGSEQKEPDTVDLVEVMGEGELVVGLSARPVRVTVMQAFGGGGWWKHRAPAHCRGCRRAAL